jgi:tight adherence protein B
VGGRLAASFESLAASIADRREVDGEVRAITSQARASTVMLAALPFVSAGLVGLIEPGVWTFLFGTGLGGICLAVAVALDVAGVAWMAAMIRGVR